MLIKDVMTKNPVTIDAKASVLEVKDIMTKNNIHKLPVVDKTGALIGIITENDLQRSTPSEATTLDVYEMGYLLSKLTVEKIMTKKVMTADVNDTVEEAARVMVDNDFGCLPVMDGNLLVGIITDSDLFKLFINMFNAREPGVRAIIDMDDGKGVLSAFCQKVADEGGKIVACITSPSTDTSKRNVTVKLTDISLEKLKPIAESCGKVEDIRKI